MNERITKAMAAESEARSKVNTLEHTADRTDAQNTELAECREKYEAAGVELRAALAEHQTASVEPKGDAEARERAEIRERASVVRYVLAAVNKRGLDGAEAEYSAAFQCDGGQMPIEMLRPVGQPEAREAEGRVATPGVTAPGAVEGIAPVMFQRTAAASLNVAFPVVPAGQANFPVLTTAPTASARAKGATAVQTAGAFRLDTRSPRRVSGSFKVRVEDLASLPGMEESLSAAIDMALAEQVDDQTFNGAAANFTTDGAIRGLFAQAADVTVAGAAETFTTGVSRFAALVDGQYAYGFGDARATIGSATFARYASQFQSNGDVSLWDYLNARLGSVRVSNRMPAVASDGQRGLVALTAGDQPIRVPVWRNVSLRIRDEYTSATEGEINVTVLALIGSPHLPYGQSTIKEVHPKLS